MAGMAAAISPRTSTAAWRSLSTTVLSARSRPILSGRYPRGCRPDSPPAPAGRQKGADLARVARPRAEAGELRAEPDRRRNHRLRRVDGLRLRAHPLVRPLDLPARRGLPVRAPDDDRQPGGDLPLDLRDDQPEPGRPAPAGLRERAVRDDRGGEEAERADDRAEQAHRRARQGDPRANPGSAEGSQELR